MRVFGILCMATIGLSLVGCAGATDPAQEGASQTPPAAQTSTADSAAASATAVSTEGESEYVKVVLSVPGMT